MQQSFLSRFIGHFKTITAHKILVGKYCFRCGLYKQGLLHDLSKYSYVEFSAGVKYYQGNRSPIDKEKEILGYSKGWLHHKGRNPHHWEYWIDVDKTTHEIKAMPMEFNYLAESICDRVAACHIYQKEKYTNASAYDFFMQRVEKDLVHPETFTLYKKYLLLIKEQGEEKAFAILKNDLKEYRRNKKAG